MNEHAARTGRARGMARLLALGLCLAALAPSSCGGKSARSHGPSVSDGGGAQGSGAETAASAAGTVSASSSEAGKSSTATGGQKTGGRAPSTGGSDGGGDWGTGGEVATGGNPSVGGTAGVSDHGGAAGAAGAYEVFRDARTATLIQELEARAAAAGAMEEPWGELSLQEGSLVSGYGCPGLPLTAEEQATLTEVGICWPQLGCPPDMPAPYLLVEASQAMLEPWGKSSRWDFIQEGLNAPSYAGWEEVVQLAVFPPADDPGCSHGAARTILLEAYDDLADEELDFFTSAAAALQNWSAHGDSPGWLAIADAFQDAVEPASFQDYTWSLVVVLGSSPDACLDTEDEEELIAAIKAESYFVQVAVIDLESGCDVDRIAEAGGILPFHISATDDPSVLADALREATDECSGARAPSPATSLPLLASSAPDATQLLIDLDEYVPALPDAAACATSRYGGWYPAPGDSGEQTVHLCPCTATQSEHVSPLPPCDAYAGKYWQSLSK